MNLIKRAQLLTALSVSVLSTAAIAAVNEPSVESLNQKIAALESAFYESQTKLRINGFFTAAYATSNDESVTENWGGITDKNDFAALSNIGIQMTFAVNDKVEMITQMVGRGEEKWNIEMEWAFLAYQVSDSFSLRMGRQKAPFYLLSEYIEVGYANPWIAAPDEVYGVTADSTYDGVGFLYDFSLGNWDTTFQGMYANNTIQAPPLDDIELNDMITVSLTGVLDNWTVRAGYTSVSADFPSLDFSSSVPGLILPGGEDVDAVYINAGFSYDNGDWLIMSEVVRLEIDGWQPDLDAMYVMAGRRFGSVMPHLTWSQMENQDPGARDIFGSAQLAAVADSLFVEEQATVTLGIRWDFMPGTAFKAELSHISDFNGTKGQFSAAAPPTDDSVDIFKVSVDAVF